MTERYHLCLALTATGDEHVARKLALRDIN